MLTQWGLGVSGWDPRGAATAERRWAPEGGSKFGERSVSEANIGSQAETPNPHAVRHLE